MKEQHNDDDDEDDEDEYDNDDDDDDDDVHQESSWLMSFTIPQESPHSKLLHSGATASHIPPHFQTLQ